MKLRIPSLKEAFGQEAEPKNKHPGSSMPSGIGGGTKKDQTSADAASQWLAAKKSGLDVSKQAVTRPTPAKKPGDLPPTSKQALWQQTQDFLKKNGSGGLAGDKTGKPATGKPGQVDMSPVPDEIKPKFKGNMIGQTFRSAGQVQKKPVSWKEKDAETGDWSWRRKSSEGPTTHELVWNGADWVTKDQFGSQFGKKV